MVYSKLKPVFIKTKVQLNILSVRCHVHDVCGYVLVWKILERFVFYCLPGPALEAHPVPGLDLVRGPTPGE